MLAINRVSALDFFYNVIKIHTGITSLISTQ